MITLRRAKERKHERRRKREAWWTFHPLISQDLLANGFGTLEILKEGRLSPRAGIRQSPQEAEIVTYVREGTLSYQDSRGQSGLINAGEFQRMTVERGIHYGEANASPTDWAHVFQIWLRPTAAGLDPGHEQKRFSAAERRGVLRLVASPDARMGSLLVHQDAFLYSAILEPGQHVIHELSEGRGAWLHIVEGELTVGSVVLQTGDGAGIVGEPGVAMTPSEGSEILLLDLGEMESKLLESAA